MPDSKKKATGKAAQADIAPSALVEDVFLMGLGVFEVTRERVGELTSDLIERGKLSRTEAKRIAKRITSSVEERQAGMAKLIAEQTHKALAASGLATKQDIDALRAEIASLKKQASAKAGGKAAPKAAAKEPAARKTAKA